MFLTPGEVALIAILRYCRDQGPPVRICIQVVSYPYCVQCDRFLTWGIKLCLEPNVTLLCISPHCTRWWRPHLRFRENKILFWKMCYLHNGWSTTPRINVDQPYLILDWRGVYFFQAKQHRGPARGWRCHHSLPHSKEPLQPHTVNDLMTTDLVITLFSFLVWVKC